MATKDGIRRTSFVLSQQAEDDLIAIRTLLYGDHTRTTTLALENALRIARKQLEQEQLKKGKQA